MWHLTKIPKKAFFYWGEEKLPYLRFLSLVTFYTYNPTWEITLYVPKIRTVDKSWTSHEQKYELQCECYFKELLKYKTISIKYFDFEWIGVPNSISEVHKSDYLRWYLLSTEGGLWSDMDIIYFKSLDDAYFNTVENTNINTIVCDRIYGHSIGFMLGEENSLYYKYIFDKSLKALDKKNYQSIGSLLINKEFPQVESIKEKFPYCEVLNLDMNFVYPYNARMIKRIYENMSMLKYTPNTVGLHWYAGHPLAAHFVNELTPTNYTNHNNAITRTIAMSSQIILKHDINKITEPHDTTTILDLGSGNMKFVKELKAKVTTLDVWDKFHPDIVHDLEQLPLPFENDSFDFITAIDVIEHIDKAVGLELLKELKRVAKKGIIIFTPKFWTPNEESYFNPKSDYFRNKHDLHKSCWYEEDFKGYEVICEEGYLEKYFFRKLIKP